MDEMGDKENNVAPSVAGRPKLLGKGLKLLPTDQNLPLVLPKCSRTKHVNGGFRQFPMTAATIVVIGATTAIFVDINVVTLVLVANL